MPSAKGPEKHAPMEMATSKGEQSIVDKQPVSNSISLPLFSHSFPV